MKEFTWKLQFGIIKGDNNLIVITGASVSSWESHQWSTLWFYSNKAGAIPNNKSVNSAGIMFQVVIDVKCSCDFFFIKKSCHLGYLMYACQHAGTHVFLKAKKWAQIEGIEKSKCLSLLRSWTFLVFGVSKLFFPFNIVIEIWKRSLSKEFKAVKQINLLQNYFILRHSIWCQN